MPGEAAVLVGRLRLGPGDPPKRAQHPLQLRCRGLAGEVEQVLLGVPIGHPREHAHLGVAEPAGLEGLADPGNLPQGARHANVLAGRAG